MKLLKKFSGVKTGEVYPTQFDVDDECPEELQDAAAAEGCFDEKALKKSAQGKQALAIKAAVEASLAKQKDEHDKIVDDLNSDHKKALEDQAQDLKKNHDAELAQAIDKAAKAAENQTQPDTNTA